jgi:hypothetical protein
MLKRLRDWHARLKAGLVDRIDLVPISGEMLPDGCGWSFGAPQDLMAETIGNS